MTGNAKLLKVLTAGIPFSQALLLFLRTLTVGLFTPVMSLLLLEKGCTLATLPLVTGVFGVTVVLLEFPSGVTADTFGRRRTFLLSQLLRLGNLALLALGFGIPVLIVAEILYGASVAFSSGSVEALVLEQTMAREGKESLPAISRTMSALDTAGIAVGALIGGAVPLLTGRYRTITLVAAVFTLAQILLCHLCVKEDMHSSQRPASIVDCVRDCGSFAWRTPLVRCLLIATVGCGILLFSIESYWQPTILEIGAPGWILGPLSFGGFAAVLLGNILISAILGKRGHWWLAFVVSRVLTAGALLVMMLQYGAPGFAGAYLMVYLFLGCSNIPENAIIHAESPDALRSSILSLVSLATRFGGVVFALFSSLAVGSLGVRGIWIVSGLSLAGITGGCALYLRSHQTVTEPKTQA